MRLAQQAYIHQAEEKMMALETVERKDGTMGVRTLHGDAVIIPTTQELEDYVYDAEKYQEILNLQQSCLQQSEEKVAIAKQAHDVVDAVVQRLDNDLAAMEQLLQVRCLFVVVDFIIVYRCAIRYCIKVSDTHNIFLYSPRAVSRLAPRPNLTIWLRVK